MNELPASMQAAQAPEALTPEQERMLRELAPKIGGLEGALVRLLLGCYDAQAARLAGLQTPDVRALLAERDRLADGLKTIAGKANLMADPNCWQFGEMAEAALKEPDDA